MSEDHRLVQAAAAGDRSAWDILLARFRPAAIAAARTVLHDEAEAEDAVQTGSARAMKGLQGLEQPGAFAAWYLRIVRNAAHDALRRRRPTENLVDGLPDGGEDPEASAERSERRDIVQSAMARLAQENEEHAEVLYLRYGEDLGYAEMARQLGTTVSAVESRLFRARKALAAILKGMGYEGT